MELISSSISNIRALEAKYSRPQNSVRLLAVSKKKSKDHILRAINSGVFDFGENYAQEALEKIEDLQLQINVMNCSIEHLGNGGKFVEYSGKIYELKNGVNDENYLEKKAEFIDCMTTYKKNSK